MTNTCKIHLVDPDYARRASIVSALLASGIHAEPFEDAAELAGHWPDRGPVLFHDSPGLFDRLHHAMTEHGLYLPLVGYGEQPPASRIVRLMLGGMAGYLDWPFDYRCLPAQLAEAGQAARAVAGSRRAALAARNRLARLSTREHEVLTALGRGLSNKGIARELNISPRTVEIHRANMMGKLEAGSAAQAVRIALEAAALEPALELKMAPTMAPAMVLT